MPGVKSQDVLQLMILGQYMDTLKDIGRLRPSLPHTVHVLSFDVSVSWRLVKYCYVRRSRLLGDAARFFTVGTTFQGANAFQKRG